MLRRTTSTLCRCGHPFFAHEHLRRGTDCVWCTDGGCTVFRAHRLGKLAAALRRVRGSTPTELRSDAFQPVVVG